MWKYVPGQSVFFLFWDWNLMLMSQRNPQVTGEETWQGKTKIESWDKENEGIENNTGTEE